MAAKTVKITHDTLRGVAGERRAELQVIDFAATTVEVLCPRGFSPRPRAGIRGRWQLVFTHTSTGDTIWQAKV